MVKAIALLSGGLDSISACRLMLEQDIKVQAIHFLTVFSAGNRYGKNPLQAQVAADKLGISLKVFDVSEEFLGVVKHPKHGYGSNMNPCIDCRIFLLKKAKEFMRKAGASFIVTGEVLGQRPMSQKKHTLRLIDRESGLLELILRPLSAKLLDASIPEKKGWVDRVKLFDIQGRSRKQQMRLAKEFGIDYYPNPGGGCLLTDAGFTRRMKDLLKYQPETTVSDIELLKVGRHFRLSGGTKFVVGRNKDDNEKLLNLAKVRDLCFMPVDVAGPVGIGRGLFRSGNIEAASSIIARYSDCEPRQHLKISYKLLPDKEPKSILATPISEANLDKIRI